MELNALEQFLDGMTNHGHFNVSLEDLRAFAQEHRELEERFKVQGEKWIESEKEITIMDERIKELEAQIAQRKGECCETCANCNKGEYSFECKSLSYRFGNSICTHISCQHYTAKPKVWKCRWKIALITSRCFTEEEARRKWNDRLIGPVEGTWEDAE